MRFKRRMQWPTSVPRPENVGAGVFEVDTGEALIIALEGSFRQAAEVESLEGAFGRASELGRNRILVDCFRAPWLNSTVLGTLITAHARAAKSGGRLVFSRVAPRLENIFEITKLSLVFDRYPTIEAGLEALRQPEVPAAS